MGKETLEAPLLAEAGKRERRAEARSEVKKQLWLAGPMIAGSLLQNVIQMISVMFVGHLGELALAGASMASSFACVTGYSLLVISPSHPSFSSYYLSSLNFEGCPESASQLILGT